MCKIRNHMNDNFILILLSYELHRIESFLKVKGVQAHHKILRSKIKKKKLKIDKILYSLRCGVVVYMFTVHLIINNSFLYENLRKICAKNASLHKLKNLEKNNQNIFDLSSAFQGFIFRYRVLLTLFLKGNLQF